MKKVISFLNWIFNSPVYGSIDYDGEMIVATTNIEEMEWRRGTGWFKWLSIFYPNKIRRYLDIRFNKEVGPEKGSWKGGTLGHGIEMRLGELHEQAFRRYCEMDHERKGRKFRLRFIGPCKAPPREVNKEQNDFGSSPIHK